jgi:hypothetical protein
MATPVSIGDVILLSQLAYRLAKCLTSGRKTVPAVLKEIKNQLLAIGNALSFCCVQEPAADPPDNANDSSTAAQRRSSDGEQDPLPVIAAMILNCRDNLQRLEALIQRYSCLEDIDEPPPAGSKRFKAKVAKTAKEQWKRIVFLSEDGELQNIKADLAIHIDSITLALCGRIQ